MGAGIGKWQEDGKPPSSRLPSNPPMPSMVSSFSFSISTLQPLFVTQKLLEIERELQNQKSV
jgi:hypothetical protein